MNKKTTRILLVIILLLLSGCGNKENERNKEEIYDIVISSEQIFSVEETSEYRCLGTQYFQGEKVQLWAKDPLFMPDGITPDETADVYLHKEDGSKQCLLTDIPEKYVEAYSWWMDNQGHYFFWGVDEIGALDEKGQELFRKKIGSNVYGICQTGDGKVITLLDMNGSTKLVEINPVMGELKEKYIVDIGMNLLAGGEDSVFLLGYQGCYEVDLEDGSKHYLMQWEGTTYNWQNDPLQETFRVLDDGSIEVLYNDGHIERIELLQVDANRTLITVRSAHATTWLKEQVVNFNQTNNDFYVVLEERSTDVDWQTFTEQTDIELATGRCVDIIMDSAMNDSHGLWTKGSFEDLRPYMEKSGITEEDYFSHTFSQWTKEDAVYGVNLMVRPRGMWMSEGLVGEDDLDIENLLSALQQYEEKTVFQEGYSPVDVVYFFLQGTSDLWGMVNWEENSCDFNTQLFVDIVETAKKYGDSESNGYPSLSGSAIMDNFQFYTLNIYQFPLENKVGTGYLFDEGCFMYLIPEIMAINADSPNKDGAWEFISFLLSQEAQLEISVDNHVSGYPSNKKAFEMLRDRQTVSDITYVLYTLEAYGLDTSNLTEEQLRMDIDHNMEDLTRMLEEARPLPVRTLPILDIIYEETSEYFSGVKSLEEVIDVIENRVQLYLDEIS